MHIQHVEFEVVPGKFGEWELYLRNYLGVLARQPGGVSFRVLRIASEQHKFISLRTWLSQADAQRAREAPELALAGKPARDGGFYAGKPAVWMEYSLLDMVWGHEAASFIQPGIYADHIVAGVGPGKWERWRPYARNFLSVMARQPGVVCEEMLRSLANPDRFIALRVFVSKEAGQVGPEFKPAAEMKLATEPAEAGKVYEGGPGATYRMCTLYDAVWGVAGAQAYDQFMRALKPV